MRDPSSAYRQAVYQHNKLVALFIGALLLGCSNTAEQRDARLNAELARVEASLKASQKASLPAEIQAIPKEALKGVERARATPSADLKLYRLRQAAVDAELLEVFVKHRDAAGKDLGPLTKLWNQRRAAFERKPAAATGPVLQRALYESSLNRGQKLFEASLPYAKVSSPFAGVYYLGEGEGNRRFAEFVASLPAGDDEPKLPRADIVEAMLESLERQTLNTFAAEPTAPKMIPVSAKLKEAREQLDRKFVSGAALSLLEARARYDKAADDKLPASLAALAAERAQPVAKKVIPASVTVTLVRWPYT